MFCKICEKERCMKHFKHCAKLHICDDCGERLGYDYLGMVVSVKERVDREIGPLVEHAVQKTLPRVLEQIMIENELTFELKVI